MNTLEKLKNRYRWISKYSSALGLLQWDQEVNMPIRAAHGRAEVIGEIAGFVFEKLTDDEMGDLIHEAEEEASSDLDRALIRFAKRDYYLYKKIPKDLFVEFEIETSKAQKVWEEAKKKSDFSIFKPNLEKVLSLAVRIAEHLGYEDNVYDAMLDLFEPGLKTSDLESFIPDLRDFLIKMLERIEEREKPVDVFKGDFDTEKQEILARRVLEFIGYDFEAGRIDVSAHPFTTMIGPGDTRITVRYDRNDLKQGLFSALHEGGHALYDQGIPEEWFGLPIGDGISMAVHESQSRFWENIIGRSLSFWRVFKPVLEGVFPSFRETSVESLWRSSNTVERSLIRTEADEVTYNLHIMIRFELEKSLVNGELDVADLPEIWNEKMREYLGIVPENDAEGVLQDVHWAHGTFGYFPSYMLGNLYSAQILHSMERDLGNTSEMIESGGIGEILNWLRKNIHSKGRTMTPKELLVEVTGEDLNTRYFKEYIEDKFSRAYGL